MKAVLISIRPSPTAKILNGEKTVEVRKTRPTKTETPFKCYIYCTKNAIQYHYIDEYGNVKFEMIPQKVVGEFICDKIYVYDPLVIACAKFEINAGIVTENRRYNAGACLTAEEMFNYSKGKTLYGWHISDLKIYDKPKELSEFGLKRPPQSWCYVKKVEEY